MEVSTASSGQPERSASTSWADKLPISALIIGAGSTVLIAFRLLCVAKFDPEVAYGILQVNGTANVIVGTAISLLPLVAIVVGTAIAVTPIFMRSDLDPVAEFLVWTSELLVGVIVLLSLPIKYFVNVAICVALVLVVSAKREAIRASRRAGGVVVRLLAVIFVFTLLEGVITGPPWMPQEHLTFRNSQPVTGYILAQTANGVTILQSNPRMILYYSGSILTQSLCTGSSVSQTPIFYFIPTFGVTGLTPYHYTKC